MGSVTFTVNEPAAGNYAMTVYFMSVGSIHTADVSVNGGTAIQVPVTGTSWSAPASTTVTVALAAGTNTLTFSNPSAYAPDLDKISVS